MADLSVTPANVAKVSGNVAHVTAGATVVAGDVVSKQVDGKYDPAIVDGTGSPTDNTTGVNGFGIALNGAGDTQPLQIQQTGVITPGAAAAEGIIYVCSAAVAGNIAPSADLSGADNDVVTIIGVGNSNGDIELSLFASGENL